MMSTEDPLYIICVQIKIFGVTSQKTNSFFETFYLLYLNLRYNSSLVSQTVKHLPTMWENQGSISGSGISPGEGNGNPLQYSCLENPMDGGTW